MVLLLEQESVDIAASTPVRRGFRDGQHEGELCKIPKGLVLCCRVVGSEEMMGKAENRGGTRQQLCSHRLDGHSNAAEFRTHHLDLLMVVEHHQNRSG
jgi:hypothetical protein